MYIVNRAGLGLSHLNARGYKFVILFTQIKSQQLLKIMFEYRHLIYIRDILLRHQVSGSLR